MKRTLTRQLLVPAAVLAFTAGACGNRVVGRDMATSPVAAATGIQGQPAVSGPVPAAEASALPAATAPGSVAPTTTGASPAVGGSAAKSPAQRSTASPGVAGSAAPVAPSTRNGGTGDTPSAPSAAGTPSAPGPGGNAPAPPTGSGQPVAIASVGQLSGVVGAGIAAGTKAVAAWAGTVNQSGGINGRPVQYFVADDGGDPGRHQALVREMVEQRRVVAFVYQPAVLSGSSSVKYLEQKRVPVIGSEAASPWFDTSPMFFPQSTQGDLAGVPMLGAAAATNPGKTKVGVVVCAEGIAICESSKRRMPEWAPKFGLKVVQTLNASLAQPDYTAECLSLRNAGAELVAFIADGSSVVRMARSCGNAGFHPRYFFAHQQTQEQFLNEPLLDGAAGSALTAPWFLSSSPAVAEYQAALKKFAPGNPPDGQTSFGWAAAKLFQRAASAVTGPLTSDAVLTALWSLRGETLGGFTMPLTFAAEQPNPQKVCFSTIKIEKKAFTSLDGGTFRCVE